VGLRWWRRATPRQPNGDPDVKTHRHATHHPVRSLTTRRSRCGAAGESQGGAARKVVDKLIRAGLLEEVRARGSLPQWRRDDDNRPLALRITKQGLEAVGVEDEAAAGIKEPHDAHGSGGAGEEAAPKPTGSRRKRASDATDSGKAARQIGRRGKARITSDKQRESRPASKQARVIAMLRATAGATMPRMAVSR
jgi:hypothetical protein